ncbi:ATP-grasp domain-containing protein [Gudongella sp. DL1XJH-153]|uniref:ATP-grasp domain-containing protein n=1 Tax=Gudongella sp. DL1XJH-153 TaxID=3409804 RepID=UPI003BB7B214
MNYVFVSPHFPSNFKYFAVAMKKEGITVLGLGSESFDSLDQELRESLTEYYRLENMENYDQMLKACGYFTFKYGKLDYIESHNEHWLELDARLRTDFNVNGFKTSDISSVKMKSRMKQHFIKAGIPVARGRVVPQIDDARRFIDEVGYPVCAKPDSGVGASNTYKIRTEQDLVDFYKSKPSIDYIMEEFINGEIHTFDGLADKEGNVVFMNSFIFGTGIMETVNESLNQFYHNQRDFPDDLLDYGLKTVKEFQLKERFFHIEFFRTTEGKLIALEINVRPPGGLSLDMFNYAYDIDIYRKYALMVAGKDIGDFPKAKYYCGFVGIKKKIDIDYEVARNNAYDRFGNLILSDGPIATVFSAALGDYAYVLRSEEFEPLRDAADYILSLS